MAFGDVPLLPVSEPLLYEIVYDFYLIIFLYLREVVKRSKVKEIIVLIKARSFLDELNLEHLTS